MFRESTGSFQLKKLKLTFLFPTKEIATVVERTSAKRPYNSFESNRQCSMSKSIDMKEINAK